MVGAVYRFGILGPLLIERDGAALTLASGRQRSLLAVLLLAGGAPRSRDRLIDELWGERPPASATSALHVHLSKLRAALGDLVVLDAGGYAVPPERFELDASRFEALVEQARDDQPQARSLLSEALALFRGEPLCDVDSEGSVAQWRRSLEEKRLEATMLRVDADLAQGAHAELIPELERLAADHPFEERVWGELILAQYRAGRQADALESFQRVRRQFAQELGLELSAPLQRLQQQMLERDPALSEQRDAEPPPTAGARASNVPRPPGVLVGREHELAELVSMATDPDARIISLTGVGGVGKTRLLLELARDQETQYRDGAVFVGLDQLREPTLVADEIATALSHRHRADDVDADGLARYLRARELLLVLDNFEHVLPARKLVAELVSTARELRVLISTRTPLQIRGEHVFDVEPLGLPTGESADEIAQSAAVQLFLQCALATNRRLDVGSDLTHTVGAICTALDGLPLAIELAASRSRSLSPAQIAQQLERPLLVGQRALRDLPERQQTLQATIQWSYDLLTPPAQGVLRAAGAFVGGFTVEALEAVTDHPVHSELDELIGASLIRRLDAVDRYALLELVRAFAVDELDVTGEASDVHARHRRFFSAYTASIGELDRTRTAVELAALLTPDHANLRAALESSIEAGDADCALALALGLRPLWHAGMLRQEAHDLTGRLLGRFQVPPKQEIVLLRAASFLDHVDSSSVRNVGFTRRLAERAAELGDQTALAIATGNLLGDAIDAGDIEEIRRLKPTLVQLASGDLARPALGWIHYNLALEAYFEGHLEQACEHASRSAEASDGDELTLAVAIATRLLAQSELDEEIPQPALAEAIDCMRRPGIKTLSAFALWFVARYAAEIAPDLGARWLAHGEQILSELEVRMWPESVLRDETMAVLGITDLTSLVEETLPVDHGTAVADAAAWLAARDAAESAPRRRVERPTVTAG